ncbi:dienelactone hydrolase family protein, partial [Salmonella enterica subsp. enterica serovar Anatum]|nr:dienelactone hydrolase family protein [Salmonella enterica subsp. enterica serovar Anatum]
IKLFQIIGRLAASFQEHGNVLEVIYHLLGLGFEGRYSVQPDGLMITGFCWGGRITWLYAAHNPQLKAAVAWYGKLVGDTSLNSP